jgi:hypothetical protein
MVTISGASVVVKSRLWVYWIAVPSDDKTSLSDGIVFDITQEALLRADNYEVSDYKHVKVALNSRIDAWVYVSA